RIRREEYRRAINGQSF
nr:Chain B, Synthesized GK inhibitor [synthetic construct]